MCLEEIKVNCTLAFFSHAIKTYATTNLKMLPHSPVEMSICYRFSVASSSNNEIEWLAC